MSDDGFDTGPICRGVIDLNDVLCRIGLRVRKLSPVPVGIVIGSDVELCIGTQIAAVARVKVGSSVDLTISGIAKRCAVGSVGNDLVASAK